MGKPGATRVLGRSGWHGFGRELSLACPHGRLRHSRFVHTESASGGQRSRGRLDVAWRVPTSPRNEGDLYDAPSQRESAYRPILWEGAKGRRAYSQLSQREGSDPIADGPCGLPGSIRLDVFPRRFGEVRSFRVDCSAMSDDLREVTLLESQAERLEKLEDLIGGLIGERRGEGKAQGRLLIHRLNSVGLRL